MRVLMWIGLFLIVLALLAWLVFKITIRIAMLLFLAGIALIIWGAFKLRRFANRP